MALEAPRGSVAIPTNRSTFRPFCADDPTPSVHRVQGNLLRRLTLRLVSTYKSVNSGFRYEPGYNPRRVLTKPSEPAGNNGFDNASANLILKVNDILSASPTQGQPGVQYRILEMLGQGTFGQVVCCEDVNTSKRYAVKVIKNKPAYHNQAKTEIRILETLATTPHQQGSNNIVRLISHFSCKSHLCLVFELLSLNIFELIKKNKFRGLSWKLVRKFLRQMLDALILLRRNNIIHCDLKPENVLLVQLTAKIKLIDFGSACFEGQTLYSYIQSRFYRSPEVILGLPYSSSIDLWSLGCMAAELYLGLPIFPGVSQFNQLCRIIKFRGMPPRYMIQRGEKAHLFFNQAGSEFQLKTAEQYARETITPIAKQKKYFKAETFDELILESSMKADLTAEQKGEEMNTRRQFLHFLSGLLCMDPHERWTADEARRHPFITLEQKPIRDFDTELKQARQGRLDQMRCQFVLETPPGPVLSSSAPTNQPYPVPSHPPSLPQGFPRSPAQRRQSDPWQLPGNFDGATMHYRAHLNQGGPQQMRPVIYAPMHPSSRQPPPSARDQRLKHPSIPMGLVGYPESPQWSHGPGPPPRSHHGSVSGQPPREADGNGGPVADWDPFFLDPVEAATHSSAHSLPAHNPPVSPGLPSGQQGTPTHRHPAAGPAAAHTGRRSRPIEIKSNRRREDPPQQKPHSEGSRFHLAHQPDVYNTQSGYYRHSFSDNYQNSFPYIPHAHDPRLGQNMHKHGSMYQRRQSLPSHQPLQDTRTHMYAQQHQHQHQQVMMSAQPPPQPVPQPAPGMFQIPYVNQNYFEDPRKNT